MSFCISYDIIHVHVYIYLSAAKIRCSKSGYYQNPNDCRQFIACLMDPYSKTPVMHLMKCPEGLVWDNIKKICMQYSTTCNVAVADNMAVNDFTRSDAANKVMLSLVMVTESGSSWSITQIFRYSILNDP